jgi:hypothetical protein
MRKFTKVVAPAVGIALAVAIAGCGSAATKTATRSNPPSQTSAATTTATASAPQAMTKAQAGQTYLADVAPANASIKAFATKARAWTDSTSSSQAAAQAQPVIQAMTGLRTKILALANAYPAAADDLKAFVTAFAPLQGDLISLQSVNALSGSSWAQQYASDASKTVAASAIVRSDLGLPASTS